MSKKVKRIKHFVCLLAVAVISVSTVSAKIITSFPINDFSVVNNTRKDNRFNKSDYSEKIFRSLGGNAYHLTDTVIHQSVAMWSREKINVAESFILDFKMYFGSGYKNDPNCLAGEGITFVLHNKSNTSTLIGHPFCYLGYAYYDIMPYPYRIDSNYGKEILLTSPSLIDSSFGIMFSTNNWEEFSLGGWHSSNWHTCMNCNIKYTKNAHYYSKPTGYFTPKPLQNNHHQVTESQWYCCRIYWRKSVVNGKTFYDMLTYVEERFDNAYIGQLLLRDSMRFESLDELITGLTVDGNGQAFVNWGITAATGDYPNIQKIEFLKLENGDLSLCPPIEINLVSNCGYDTTHLFKSDTVVVGCVQTYTWPIDTLTDESICMKDPEVKPNPKYIIQILGIDISNAKWYINGDSVSNNLEWWGDGDMYVYPLYKYIVPYLDEEYIEIKLIICGREINFKFRANAEEGISGGLVGYFNQSDKDAFYDKNTNTLFAFTDQLYIPLSLSSPYLSNCRYELSYYDELDGKQKIELSNNLSFALKKGIDQTEVSMDYVCGDCLKCLGTFNFTVYNSTPEIIVTKNCNGGAKITIKGGNSSGLLTKWLDKDGNEIGGNDSSIVVYGGSIYKLAYYHPSNPTKIIHTVRIDIDEIEIPAEYRDAPNLAERIIEDNNSKFTETDINGSATIEVNMDNLEQSLRLPDLPEGCEYSITAEDSYFDVPPTINEDTGELEFKFKPNVCEPVSFTVSYSCEGFDCLDEFAITVSNPDCEEATPCDGIEQSLVAYRISMPRYPNVGTPVVYVDKPAELEVQRSDNDGRCSFPMGLPRTFNIIGFKTESDGSIGDAWLPGLPDGESVENFYNFTYNMRIECDRQNIGAERIDIMTMIVADEHGNECPIIQKFKCICAISSGGFDDWTELEVDISIHDDWLQHNYPLTANYTIGSSSSGLPLPPIPVPLDFWLYNSQGNRLQRLYRLNVGDNLCGSFNFEMPYPAGTYFISLETADGRIVGDVAFIKR